MGATAIPWVQAIGTIASAGAAVHSSHKQTQAASKARKQQNAMIAQAKSDADAERNRLENIEKERLDKLRKRGSGLPPSLITGFTGVQGAPTILG